MTPPAGTLASSRAETAAAARTAPARAAGVELLGRMTGSGYERAPSLVRRSDGQTLQLTPLLYAVLELIDGRQTTAEIAAALCDRTGRQVEADDVEYLIEHKLRPLGVVRTTAGDEPEVVKSNPLLALRLRFVVSNPRITRRITRPFALLFRSYVALPMLVAFTFASVWLLLEKGLASATHEALYNPGQLLLIFALAMISAGFHEFGHAAACRYGGATPGAMGAGLYLVWPAFYTDVTDSYRLSRWGRIRVDIGGLYFNAIFAVATVAAWWVTGWEALLLIVPAQLLQMVRQLLPFVRFDGYHILADVTGVPDLFAHIKPTLLGLLPTRWRRRPSTPLKRWARGVVTAWTLLVLPILAFSLVLMVKVMPRVAATAWDSLGMQAQVLAENWASGAFADVGVRLLAMFTIALPVASMTYMLARVVRRAALRAWRATRDRPPERALVVLGVIAGLALLAWAWWPEGQYRPIQPHERGTLLQALSVAPPEPVLVSAEGTQAQPLVVGGATTYGIPTRDLQEIDAASAPADMAGATPRLGVVLTPKEPGGEEHVVVLPRAAEADDPWPFPFNHPRAPRPGDNQALAVNTTDGSTLYDVSFALVWVTDGDQLVDQRNEAYALASCAGCTTVAVAFQVILVVGQADVIVPENVAVAVNYDCIECQTYALAVQLIATLTDVPTDEAMQQLAALEREMAALEAEATSMSLADLHTRIVDLETRIVQILTTNDGASATVESDAEEAAVEPVTGTTPTPTPVPSTVVAPARDDATTSPSETATTEPAEGETATTEPEPFQGPSEAEASDAPSPQPEDQAEPTAAPQETDSTAGSETQSEPEPTPEPSPEASEAP